MKVFKFGGASVSTVERIKNTAAIIDQFKDEKLLIVLSAMGKTTNALEQVVDSFYNREREKALQLFDTIKQQHLQIQQELANHKFQNPNSKHETSDAKHQTSNLGPRTSNPGYETSNLAAFFTEIEWLLHDKPVNSYDYYYDQIVCVGELLSSTIVSEYLQQLGVPNSWVDVRDILRTDDNFRDAKIDWQVTEQKMNAHIVPMFDEINIVITQGFIGATDENESTTLGREGSDYTAAVFANLLNAESVTIWKDVQGVMNADPKEYMQAEWIRELNYREVIEMAYYGAQVIHPKTIKPLQNKEIPLYVKSFINPTEEGTRIHNNNIQSLPSIIVYKQKQVLVKLSSRDFSFASEGLTVKMLDIFNRLKFKPNLTQNAAISLLYVVDDQPDKVDALCSAAAGDFEVVMERDLTLLTIRHYHDGILSSLVGDHSIVLTQRTPETIQVLMKK